MSNIIRELSRANCSRSLRSNDNSTSAPNSSTYNLESSSYEINIFTNSLPASLVASSPTSSPASSTTSSYNHHIVII